MSRGVSVLRGEKLSSAPTELLCVVEIVVRRQKCITANFVPRNLPDSECSEVSRAQSVSMLRCRGPVSVYIAVLGSKPGLISVDIIGLRVNQCRWYVFVGSVSVVIMVFWGQSVLGTSSISVHEPLLVVCKHHRLHSHLIFFN